LQEAVH